jgi:hypothetical protein
VELYFHSSHTSSWCGAQLNNAYIFIAWYLVKYSDNFTFFFTFCPRSDWLRAERSDDGVRVPAMAGNFSLHHRVQTGFGPQPASYPMGTGGSSLGGKEIGA